MLRSYHLEVALAVAKERPLIITVPADLAYLVAEQHGLVIKRLPFEFKPFEYSLLWHARCEHSSAQRWIRSVLQEECGRLIDKRIEDLGLG